MATYDATPTVYDLPIVRDDTVPCGYIYVMPHTHGPLTPGIYVHPSDPRTDEEIEQAADDLQLKVGRRNGM